MIVLAVVGRRAEFDLPFSEEALDRQRQNVLKGMTAKAACCLFFPLAYAAKEPLEVFIIVLGLLAIGLAALWTSFNVPLVRVAKIEGNYVFIKDVCWEFLSELPEF